MRSVGISLVSLGLTAAVIGNAYYQKKQFYTSVVYITKSNPSMAVIYIQSLILVLMLGKLMRKIFLGTLRASEFEHLMERFWYALTETCLAFTVFRDDFNPKFVALFTVLLFLKSFHWLAEDRVDYMERSPVIGWVFHIRVAGLLGFLGLLDYMLIAYAYQSTIAKGATVQLVFGFEYAILITMVANTTIKYVLHAAELRSENPWENKAVFLLYTELIIGLIRVILYVIFVFLMVKIYTLPLFAFRPMYYTLRNFKKALNDVILSRRAIRNMNTLYPDATEEELSTGDNICIICREDMITNSKKLPCGHIFHTACLRSWFQRQQTCPTCRLNILRTPTPPTTNPPAAGIAAPAAAAAAIAAPQPLNNPFANLLNGPNPFNFGMPPPINVQPTPATSGATATISPTAPFVMPSFPYAVPPPPMPPNLDTLSDEELRALEGTERKHVEERIKLLRNIQTLMDASVALMNQYSAITARLPAPPAPPPPPAAEPAPVTTQEQPSPPTADEPIAKLVTTEQGDLVKIEDLGSEDHLDSVQATSTLTATASAGDDKVQPSTSKVVDPTPSSAMPNDEHAELRRRRLQKFLSSEAKNND